MKKINLFLLIGTAALCSSCATIFSGTKQKITVTGNVETPVELLVDGVSYSNVKLPAKVKIKRKNPTSRIAAFAPNYNVEKQELDKTFNHLVWLNTYPWLPVLPIPLFVDWQTGAYKRAVQKTVNFEFAPVTSAQEIYAAHIDFGTEHYNADLLDEALYYFNQAYEIDTLNDIALQKINAVYARMDYLENLARLKAERGEMWSNILTLVGVGLQTTASVMSAAQANNASDSNAGSSSNTAKSTSHTNSANKKADCGNAWITDDRTYRNYETQLVKMRTYPEQYPHYADDYSSIQSKMRQIRQKWESRGCQINKSQYE